MTIPALEQKCADIMRHIRCLREAGEDTKAIEKLLDSKLNEILIMHHVGCGKVREN